MKDEIIAQLAQKKIVEKLIKSVTKSGDNLDDLAQDLYISLLQKDEELITDLYRKGQLCFYIKAMIKKNLLSKTSRYYYKYKKQRELIDFTDDLTKYEEGE